MPPTPAPRRFQITVIGNSQALPAALVLAEEVGNLLGRLGCTVVTGGGSGIMEAVCRGARSQGATTVGILPGNTLDGGNPWLDVVIPSGMGYARNMSNVLAADVVIAIGGSAGTLSEIAYAWMHNRPIIAMAGADGWAARLAGQAVDDRRPDVIECASDLKQLEALLIEHMSRAGI